MSDVVAAAAIAGGVSVVGNVTTILVARWQTRMSRHAVERQAATGIATIERQAEVELAKVRADLDRLREEHREAERQNRQGTYHRLIAVVDRFIKLGAYGSPTDEEYAALLADFNHLYAAVDLFGDAAVREAAIRIARLLNEVGREAAKLEGTRAERFAQAADPRRKELKSELGELADAMRVDVTRTIFEPE